VLVLATEIMLVSSSYLY